MKVGSEAPEYGEEEEEGEEEAISAIAWPNPSWDGAGGAGVAPPSTRTLPSLIAAVRLKAWKSVLVVSALPEEVPAVTVTGVLLPVLLPVNVLVPVLVLMLLALLLLLVAVSDVSAAEVSAAEVSAEVSAEMSAEVSPLMWVLDW